MTIQLELTPQEETQLREHAARSGAAAEELVAEWVRLRLAPPTDGEPVSLCSDSNSDAVRASSAAQSAEEIAGIRQEVRWLALQGEPPEPAADAWRATVGMFREDPAMERILEASDRYRRSQRDDP